MAENLVVLTDEPKVVGSVDGMADEWVA